MLIILLIRRLEMKFDVTGTTLNWLQSTRDSVMQLRVPQGSVLETVSTKASSVAR